MWGCAEGEEEACRLEGQEEGFASLQVLSCLAVAGCLSDTLQQTPLQDNALDTGGRVAVHGGGNG